MAAHGLQDDHKEIPADPSRPRMKSACENKIKCASVLPSGNQDKKLNETVAERFLDLQVSRRIILSLPTPFDNKFQEMCIQSHLCLSFSGCKSQNEPMICLQ